MEARVSIIKMFGKKTAKRPVNSDMDKQRKYEALVRAYHRDLFRYAYWLCKDKSIAEDLVQETCLRAWKSLDSLQDEKAAKSWLITILRRETLGVLNANSLIWLISTTTVTMLVSVMTRTINTNGCKPRS